MWSDIVGALLLLTYYLIVCVLLPTVLKVLTGMPNEIVRKMQHVAYSFSIFILIKLFSTWYMAIMAAGLLILLAYPVLLIIEKLPLYRDFFVDRKTKGGELRIQLLLVQLSFALLLFLFWGVLGTNWRFLIPVAVMGWGFGDAAAAVIGKAFGQKKVISRFVDGPKTYAGTVAMIVAASAAIFLTLTFYAGKPWYVSLVIAAVVAPVSALVELFSRRGLDTLTVPLTVAFLTLPMIHLLSLLGW
jgi:phytol kinase